MPLFEQHVTIACVSNEVGGNLVGNALWTGVRLKELLDRAGVREATQIVEALGRRLHHRLPDGPRPADDRESMVAVGMNEEPLPANHGYPARLIVPGLFGYVSATKWLTEIELTTRRVRRVLGAPRLGRGADLAQSRIDVPHDGANVDPGTMAVAGVAWAPDRGVRRVEVEVDEEGWQEAEM